MNSQAENETSLSSPFQMGPGTTTGKQRRLSQKGMTLLEIMIVLAILALVMGFLVGPRVLKMFGESKTEVGRTVAQDFAFSAYTQWSAAHPGKRCPGSLTELLDFSNKKDTKDPWGTEYRMLCGENAPAGAKGGMGVQAAGEDGKFDTSDDLRSWE